ncbi:MAG TPA: YceI family protein [Candidatus Angelobacter sp.]|nr:YceI family protein [Candidatus Angelobacter sp.]
MRKILGLLLAVAAASGSAVAADEFKIDPAHSSVNFSVTHMMVSTVNGRFTAFEGKILYDDKDLAKSSVSVSIKTASINTDNSSRDGDLKSASYFDVEKLPEITFQSKSIEKKGNDYVAHGTLTIHGVAKDVDMPFELKGPVDAGKMGKVMGAHGSLTVNRQDYGVGKATPMISNEVKIDLNVEARMAPPAPAGK